MTYTTHGFHIRGTILSDEPPPRVYRCGGPGVCKQCSEEAARTQLFYQPTPRPRKIMDYQQIAKDVVIDYVNKRPYVMQEDPLVSDNVYVVWFAKTLQNWKALVSTNVSDGMYYELTFNGDKNELYLDSYKKFENVVINMEEISKPASQIPKMSGNDLRGLV